MREREEEKLRELGEQIDANNHELAAAVEANTPADEAAPSCVSKPPHEWAIAKGYLRLNDDGSYHFKNHTPWEFYGARVARKWSDPDSDPSFAITEAEFDEAIQYVLGVTAG